MTRVLEMSGTPFKNFYLCVFYKIKRDDAIRYIEKMHNPKTIYEVRNRYLFGTPIVDKVNELVKKGVHVLVFCISNKDQSLGKISFVHSGYEDIYAITKVTPFLRNQFLFGKKVNKDIVLYSKLEESVKSQYHVEITFKKENEGSLFRPVFDMSLPGAIGRISRFLNNRFFVPFYPCLDGYQGLRFYSHCQMKEEADKEIFVFFHFIGCNESEKRVFKAMVRDIHIGSSKEELYRLCFLPFFV